MIASMKKCAADLFYSDGQSFLNHSANWNSSDNQKVAQWEKSVWLDLLINSESMQYSKEKLSWTKINLDC